MNECCDLDKENCNGINRNLNEYSAKISKDEIFLTVVISGGGSLWAYLPPVSEGEEERTEVSSVEVEHSSEVGEAGEESSGTSSNVSKSGSGWWFSPKRRFLPKL